MSDLPAPNSNLDGIIKWTRDQLGRHPTEGEIAVVRVAMEMKSRRRQNQKDRKQQAFEATAVRRRQDDQHEEDDFKKRMQKEIDDDYIFAICLIYLSHRATEWHAPAKASKAVLLKTNPINIIGSGSTLKATETVTSFEVPPPKRHRALLAYIASKMPELALNLPKNPPHFGVDNPVSFYDMTWEVRATLHPHHQYLINAQRPERITQIFKEVVDTYSHDSGPLMRSLAREGERAIPAIRDFQEAFAFSPGEPPMALLPEPPKPDLDDLLTDAEGLDMDSDFTPAGM